MKYNNPRRTSGFTMVELLIAIIIIGILVAIIVPVLSNRASDARIAAAQADMEAIANGQSQVALDTGYIVRLHVLDDSGAPTDNRGSDDINDVVDTIVDEHLNVTNNGRPDYIFLDAKTGAFLPNNLYARVQANPEQFGWRGPYLNYQRKITPTSPPVEPWTFGSPLDPWGNPYFLFVAGVELSGASSNGAWVDERAGDLSTNFNYGGFAVQADRFDRNTLLSLGPDGAPGAGGTTDLGTGDDLVRAF